MQADHLSKWLAFGANLGVIVGLVFVALEIRQANKIALVSTELGVRDTYAQLNETVYTNSEVADVLFRARDSETKFEGADSEVAEKYAYRNINTWVGLETAHENGLLPSATFESVSEDIRVSIAKYPGLAPYYRSVVGDYDSYGDLEVFRLLDKALDDHGF